MSPQKNEIFYVTFTVTLNANTMEPTENSYMHMSYDAYQPSHPLSISLSEPLEPPYSGAIVAQKKEEEEAETQEKTSFWMNIKQMFGLV